MKSDIEQLRETRRLILDKERSLACHRDEFRAKVAEVLEKHFGPIQRAFDATARIFRTETVNVSVCFEVQRCIWEATSADSQFSRFCVKKVADDPLTAVRLAVEALGEIFPEEAAQLRAVNPELDAAENLVNHNQPPAIKSVTTQAINLMIESEDKRVSREARRFCREVAEQILAKLFAAGEDDDPGVRNFLTSERIPLKVYFAIKDGAWVAWGYGMWGSYEGMSDDPLVAIDQAIVDLSRKFPEEANELRTLVKSSLLNCSEG